MKPRTIATLLAAVALAGAVTVERGFDAGRLRLEQQDGMTVVGMDGCVPVWETGAPALPLYCVQAVVPQGMKVVGVTLLGYETEPVEGEYDVYPVQPPRPLSDPGPFEFAGPDPRYYGLPAYPAEVVTAAHQGSMAGYNIASAFVAPVQYLPAERKLLFHPTVRFAFELEPAELGYLEVKNRSPEAVRRIEAQLASFVVNPEDIARYAP